ncbi:hypothetical protein CU097_004679 [Rhizopus azygosporus]|uniref:Uncharacterized protein n=1 Tax=Rhizopus azygosporus TaxID=86630 RepID=A0A367JCR7_RHIAZ|nr:hypothetical protein CU097_004679 [Rhizopus azygosporus]
MVLLKWQTASKDCLDKAIKNGVDHSVLTVCGLLCESGYQKGGNEIVTQDSHAVLLTIDSQYKAFAIDLKYHVMYRLIEIGTFYLPRDYNNLDIMLGAKLSWKQHAKKKQFDETAMMVTCVYHHLPPPSIRLAEDQFKFLLQNLDPVRLTHAAQKLDFSNYFHKRIVMVASSAVILSIFTEHHLHCKNVKSWGVFQVMMYRVWVDAAVRSMEQCVD